MKPTVRPLAVLLKGLTLFVVLNLVYAFGKVSPATVSLINHGIPGFERFPVIRTPIARPDGTVGVSKFQVTDLSLLFGAHQLSVTPKASDEYRVFFFGDSSMWGAALSNDETLVHFINEANLLTCSGQRIRAYSLGYPTNSAIKDLLILAYSDVYAPDMFVWTFSLQAFVPDRQNILVDDNLTTLRDLYLRHNLKLVYKPAALLDKPGLFDRTIWAQRKTLRTGVDLQGFALSRYLYGTDNLRAGDTDDEMVVEPTPATLGYGNSEPADKLFKGNWLLPFDTLRAANDIANKRPLLLVNEPIFIASDANSDIRYNWLYPRWAFDQYRELVQERADKNQWLYIDSWNLLPQSEFLDKIFHRTAQGNQHLADALIPLILESSCK